MRRNLNLVARSFYKMPTNFFALRSMVSGLRNEASEMRKNAYVSACGDILNKACEKVYRIILK